MLPHQASSLWCSGEDLNLHGFPRHVLSVVRIPIPPPERRNTIQQNTKNLPALSERFFAHRSSAREPERRLQYPDDGVRPEDDDQPYDTPDHVLLAGSALLFVVGVPDEVHDAPNKEHEGRERDERDERREDFALHIGEECLDG